MSQQTYSTPIAPSTTKVCPKCGTTMHLAKSGSTFVWRCPACQHTEPLTDVHTERHTFTFIPRLNELKIAWPGVPRVTQFLSIEECYQLQRLLAEVCQP
jgi:ssDNA-binding Zn-finger/Zn-ribbon topoisomerase 1